MNCTKTYTVKKNHKHSWNNWYIFKYTLYFKKHGMFLFYSQPLLKLLFKIGWTFNSDCNIATTFEMTPTIKIIILIKVKYAFLIINEIMKIIEIVNRFVKWIRKNMCVVGFSRSTQIYFVCLFVFYEGGNGWSIMYF